MASIYFAGEVSPPIYGLGLGMQAENLDWR